MPAEDWQRDRPSIDLRVLGPDSRTHLSRVFEGRIQALRDVLEDKDDPAIRGVIKEYRWLLNELNPPSPPDAAPYDSDDRLAAGY